MASRAKAMSIAIALFLAIGCAPPEREPRPAADLMREAAAEAKATNRRVLVQFSATWCGPCKALWNRWHEDDLRPRLEKHFVMIKLNALDTDPAKLDPGARELFVTTAKGERPIPFLAVFDDTGKPIGTEIGQYIAKWPRKPMDRQEQTLRMLHMTAKKMSLDEVRAIRLILEGE